MQNAKLPDGTIINAKEYIESVHKGKIYCVYCGATVIHVNPEDRDPFFKTTGQTDKSRHLDNCVQKRNLQVFDSLKMINKYTTKLADTHSNGEYIIKINFDSFDIRKQPKGQTPEIGFDHHKKKLPYANGYTNYKDSPIKSITSLKTIARLLKNKPEELAKIVLVVNGQRYRLNELVLNQNQANELARSNIGNLDYIVYGQVMSVKRREKVIYINMSVQDGMEPFTAMVFKKYFVHFKYKDEKLIGNPVLIAGRLKLNDRNNKAEMVIYSSKQLEVL